VANELNANAVISPAKNRASTGVSQPKSQPEPAAAGGSAQTFFSVCARRQGAGGHCDFCETDVRARSSKGFAASPVARESEPKATLERLQSAASVKLLAKVPMRAPQPAECRRRGTVANELNANAVISPAKNRASTGVSQPKSQPEPAAAGGIAQTFFSVCACRQGAGGHCDFCETDVRARSSKDFAASAVARESEPKATLERLQSAASVKLLAYPADASAAATAARRNAGGAGADKKIGESYQIPRFA